MFFIAIGVMLNGAIFLIALTQFLIFDGETEETVQAFYSEAQPSGHSCCLCAAGNGRDQGIQTEGL